MYSFIKRSAVRIILLTLCVLHVLTLTGQNKEESLFQASAEAERLSSNSIVILQQGHSNEAYIQQISLSNTNVIEVIQFGNDHYINLTQAGYNNSIRIDQTGQGNRYDGDIDGTDLIMDIFQYGYDNSISQSVLSGSGLHSILQEGDRNEIVQTGNMWGTQGLRIHQQGTGMKIIINSN